MCIRRLITNKISTMDKRYDNLLAKEYHLLRDNRNIILVDVKTLEVYILDELEGSIIEAMTGASANEKIDVLITDYGNVSVNEKVKGLSESGILVNKDKKERVKEKDKNQDTDISDPIRAMNISISEDCNLACKYCFVKNGKYHGKTDLMKPVVGKKSIDFLIKRSGGQKDLFVTFFGGEPLINFRVLTEIVHYAKKQGEKLGKRFHFSMTTNGVLLDGPMVGFIKEHQISVQISIDGDIHSHNQNRPLPGGGGSYSKIINNLEKLNQADIKYSVRVTVSSLTKNKMAGNFQHLFSQGFRRVHFESALAPKGKIFITSRDDIEDIKSQYVEISKEIEAIIQSGKPYNIEMFPLPLKKIDRKEKVFYPCAAGRGNIAVGVNGDIFLCHRLVGKKSFIMGNVIDSTYNNKALEKHICSLHVDNKDNCKDCWARYLCGGGCYAINDEFNKDISQTPDIYCEFKKHTIEQALVIYAKTAQTI